jgi:hypothetical protein
VDIKFSDYLGCELREVPSRQIAVTIAVAGTLNVCAKWVGGNRHSIAGRRGKRDTRFQRRGSEYSTWTTGKGHASRQNRKLFEKIATS